MPIKLASHGDERGSADSDDHAEESHSTGLNPERQQPLVCCVTLTKDRPQMLQRAIACFRAQTFRRKTLLIWDTGTLGEDYGDQNIIHAIPDSQGEWSIGKLRNAAADFIADAEVIVHFDDDDWSHPERIAEQVALLQASGKECVGYREMLFWDTRMEDPSGGCVPQRAWLYTNGNPRYCLGTSLCYWRSVWERRPFEDKAYGEDTAWLLGVDSLAGSMYGSECFVHPRMIAAIHAGNTSPAYRGELMRASEKQGGEWRRAPQWDDYARGVMEAHGKA